MPTTKTTPQRSSTPTNVADMRRQLPGGAEAFAQLAPSHRRKLLPLRDPAKVEKIARALSMTLSVRDLRGIVEEVERSPMDSAQAQIERLKDLVQKLKAKA